MHPRRLCAYHVTDSTSPTRRTPSQPAPRMGRPTPIQLLAVLFVRGHEHHHRQRARAARVPLEQSILSYGLRLRTRTTPTASRSCLVSKFVRPPSFLRINTLILPPQDIASTLTALAPAAA
jgi:hypothetical protein